MPSVAVHVWSPRRASTLGKLVSFLKPLIVRVALPPRSNEAPQSEQFAGGTGGEFTSELSASPVHPGSAGKSTSESPSLSDPSLHAGIGASHESPIPSP